MASVSQMDVSNLVYSYLLKKDPKCAQLFSKSNKVKVLPPGAPALEDIINAQLSVISTGHQNLKRKDTPTNNIDHDSSAKYKKESPKQKIADVPNMKATAIKKTHKSESSSDTSESEQKSEKQNVALPVKGISPQVANINHKKKSSSSDSSSDSDSGSEKASQNRNATNKQLLNKASHKNVDGSSDSSSSGSHNNKGHKSQLQTKPSSVKANNWTTAISKFAAEFSESSDSESEDEKGMIVSLAKKTSTPVNVSLAKKTSTPVNAANCKINAKSTCALGTDLKDTHIPKLGFVNKESDSSDDSSSESENNELQKNIQQKNKIEKVVNVKNRSGSNLTPKKAFVKSNSRLSAKVNKDSSSDVSSSDSENEIQKYPQGKGNKVGSTLSASSSKNMLGSNIGPVKIPVSAKSPILKSAVHKNKSSSDDSSSDSENDVQKHSQEKEKQVETPSSGKNMLNSVKTAIPMNAKSSVIRPLGKTKESSSDDSSSDSENEIQKYPQGRGNKQIDKTLNAGKNILSSNLSSMKASPGNAVSPRINKAKESSSEDSSSDSDNATKLKNQTLPSQRSTQTSKALTRNTSSSDDSDDSEKKLRSTPKQVGNVDKVQNVIQEVGKSQKAFVHSVSKKDSSDSSSDSSSDADNPVPDQNKSLRGSQVKQFGIHEKVDKGSSSSDSSSEEESQKTTKSAVLTSVSKTSVKTPIIASSIKKKTNSSSSSSSSSDDDDQRESRNSLNKSAGVAVRDTKSNFPVNKNISHKDINKNAPTKNSAQNRLLHKVLPSNVKAGVTVKKSSDSSSDSSSENESSKQHDLCASVQKENVNTKVSVKTNKQEDSSSSSSSESEVSKPINSVASKNVQKTLGKSQNALPSMSIPLSGKSPNSSPSLSAPLPSCLNQLKKDSLNSSKVKGNMNQSIMLNQKNVTNYTDKMKNSSTSDSSSTSSEDESSHHKNVSNTCNIAKAISVQSKQTGNKSSDSSSDNETCTKNKHLQKQASNIPGSLNIKQNTLKRSHADSSSDSDSSNGKESNLKSSNLSQNSNVKKAVPSPSKKMKQKDSSSDSSSSSEEEEDKSKVSYPQTTKLSASFVQKKDTKDSSDSSSDSDSDQPVNKTASNVMTKSPSFSKRKRSSSSSSDLDTKDKPSVENEKQLQDKNLQPASLTSTQNENFRNQFERPVASDSTKQRRGSSPFRRVRSENVNIDYRLQQSSQLAKQAAPKLEAVRGKNFRHEKTKKKKMVLAGKVDTSVKSIQYD